MQDFVSFPSSRPSSYSITSYHRTTFPIQFAMYDPIAMKSRPGIRTDLFTSRSLNQTLVTDFFGGVAQAEILDDHAYEYGLEDSTPISETHSGSVRHAPESMGQQEATSPSSQSPPEYIPSFDTSSSKQRICKEGTENILRAWLTILGLGALCSFSFWSSKTTLRTSQSATYIS